MSVPVAIVWHYTATDPGTALSLCKRITKYDSSVDRAASWHLIIGVDGRVYQSVSFLCGAWHCAKGTIGGHSVNKTSVGIELEGHGDIFTPAQIDAAEEVVVALRVAYGISEARAKLLHSEFDPKRRSDPGPIWSGRILPALLRRVYGKV
jgi:N-acetyl-anhydromuramyl-L-alanine amidase AmpD